MEGNAGQAGVASPPAPGAPAAQAPAPAPNAPSNQAPAPAPDPAPTAPAMVAPNQYQLSGGGLTISYFPLGRGPIGPAGATALVYQDAHHTLTFTKEQVQTDHVGDLGTLLSVTLTESVDIGFTSFTLLLPAVQLPDRFGATAHICTEGITTTHRIFAGLIGHAQAQSYTTTHLYGTAALAILEA